MSASSRSLIAALLLAGSLIAGCWARPVPSEPPPPSPPAPAVTGGEPVTLRLEEGGAQLMTSSGEFGPTDWLSPSRLLVRWYPDATGPRPTTTWLADLEAGSVRSLVTSNWQEVLAPPENGRHAVLLWTKDDSARSMGAGVLDVTTGKVETAFSLDLEESQWAAAADRRWEFGEKPGILYAQWVGRDTFLLALTPLDGYSLGARHWGKLLAVNIAARQVRVLAERGELAAVMPDESLLVRRGWMDGEVLLTQPPYDLPPREVAPAGPWTWSWALSPNGAKVAWLELEALGGRFTQNLPGGC